MKLLLDTHAFIWFVENDNNLPESVRNLIENIENEILISIASLWEIAIKASLNKLELKNNIESIIKNMSLNGFSILEILPEHIITVSKLPFHHRDPFDRIIIAQSLTENIKIVGRDIIFKEYNVDLIW